MKRKKVPNVLEKSAEEIEYYCAWKKLLKKTLWPMQFSVRNSANASVR